MKRWVYGEARQARKGGLSTVEKGIVDNGYNKRQAARVQVVIGAMVRTEIVREVIPEEVIDIGFDVMTGDYIRRPHGLH